MLEPPDIATDTLSACLRNTYGLHITDITFLPLGADVNTAVYRAVADDATPYFLKLRSGGLEEAAVTLPRLLRAQGIQQVITPVETCAGKLWTVVDGFIMTLFPFVVGQDGYERRLTDQQWVELGTVLRALHSMDLPVALMETIPREEFAPHFRDLVRLFQQQAGTVTFADPIAAQMATVMQEQRDIITKLVNRAERYANKLRARLDGIPCVPCHADIHAWNVLIDESGKLYVVDWDTLIIAPKERDLMFIGAGIGDADWSDPRSAALLYQGYGPTEVDATAIAYYRYQRIVEDFAAYGEQLLLTDEGGDDRAQSLRYFASQFEPGDVVEIAFATDSER